MNRSCQIEIPENIGRVTFTGKMDAFGSLSTFTGGSVTRRPWRHLEEELRLKAWFELKSNWDNYPDDRSGHYAGYTYDR